MKLFDRIRDDETGEVRIREAETSTDEDEGLLRGEVEARLKGDASTGSSDTGSTATTGLPGMGTGSTASSGSNTSSSWSSSSSVSLEDVHDQNRKIIGLLQDIKSELGGSSHELL